MTQPFVNSADQFFTGTGILLQGDPFRANTTGFGNVPLKDGRVEYFCAVGFPKDQPAATGFNELWATMQQVAQTHPNAAQYIPAGFAGFHWKMEDGDAPQHAGKTGWKGCWVIKFKNGFQPQVFDENRNAVPSPYNDVLDQEGKLVSQTQKPGVAHPFPCGHFVRVMCAIKPNKSAPPQSGLYLNFNMIQRVGYGTPIYSGPDYGQVMGSQQAAALPGMSAMPVGGPAPAMAQPQGVPGGALPGGVPAALPGAVPGGALPGVGGLPAPAGLPAAPGPAAPAPVETPQSRMIDQQYTYDQYIQAGYTEAGMIAQGLMRPAAAPQPPAGGGLPQPPGALPPAAGGLPGPGALPGQPPAAGALPGMPPAAGGLPPVNHTYNQ